MNDSLLSLIAQAQSEQGQMMAQAIQSRAAMAMNARQLALQEKELEANRTLAEKEMSSRNRALMLQMLPALAQMRSQAQQDAMNRYLMAWNISRQGAIDAANAGDRKRMAKLGSVDAPGNPGYWGFSDMGIHNAAKDLLPGSAMAAGGGLGATYWGNRRRGAKLSKIADEYQSRISSAEGEAKAKLEAEFAKASKLAGREGRLARAGGRMAAGLGLLGLIGSGGKLVKDYFDTGSASTISEAATRAYKDVYSRSNGFQNITPEMLSITDPRTGLTYKQLLSQYAQIARDQGLYGGNVGSLVDYATSQPNYYPGQFVDQAVQSSNTDLVTYMKQAAGDPLADPALTQFQNLISQGY